MGASLLAAYPVLSATDGTSNACSVTGWTAISLKRYGPNIKTRECPDRPNHGSDKGESCVLIGLILHSSTPINVPENVIVGTRIDES